MEILVVLRPISRWWFSYSCNHLGVTSDNGIDFPANRSMEFNVVLYTHIVPTRSACFSRSI